jgi:hypothetical protein
MNVSKSEHGIEYFLLQQLVSFRLFWVEVDQV